MRSEDEVDIFDDFDDDDTKQKNSAQVFFTVIACVLWIGGFIFAAYSAFVTGDRDIQSQFSVFISTFAIFFISGCFSVFAAELFKILQKILNTLNETKKMMSKW